MTEDWPRDVPFWSHTMVAYFLELRIVTLTCWPYLRVTSPTYLSIYASIYLIYLPAYLPSYVHLQLAACVYHTPTRINMVRVHSWSSNSMEAGFTTDMSSQEPRQAPRHCCGLGVHPSSFPPVTLSWTAISGAESAPVSQLWHWEMLVLTGWLLKMIVALGEQDRNQKNWPSCLMVSSRWYMLCKDTYWQHYQIGTDTELKSDQETAGHAPLIFHLCWDSLLLRSFQPRPWSTGSNRNWAQAKRKGNHCWTAGAIF